MDGLLNNPMFNIGIGLLSARGMPQGLLTGMQQYQQNLKNAQAMQYQEAIMEQMKEKAAQAKAQDEARQRAILGMSTTQEPGMYDFGGVQMPTAQGLYAGTEQGIPSTVDVVDQQKRDLLNAFPGAVDQMVQQQLIPSGIQRKLTDDEKEFLSSKGLSRDTQFTPELGAEFGRWLSDIKESGSTKLSIEEKSAQKTWGERQVGQLFDDYEKRLDSASEFPIIAQQERLLDEGMATGMFADFKVGLGKLAREFGYNISGNDVENAEAYRSVAGERVAKIIKAFGAGTGLSNADRDFAERIAAGKITLDERTLRKLLFLRKKYLREGIRKYNDRARKAMESGIIKDAIGPITIDLPEERPNKWGYIPGQLIEKNGKQYEYMFGDPTNKENWRIVY